MPLCPKLAQASSPRCSQAWAAGITARLKSSLANSRLNFTEITMLGDGGFSFIVFCYPRWCKPVASFHFREGAVDIYALWNTWRYQLTRDLDESSISINEGDPLFLRHWTCQPEDSAALNCHSRLLVTTGPLLAKRAGVVLGLCNLYYPGPLRHPHVNFIAPHGQLPP